MQQGKAIGIIYNSRMAEAKALAEALLERLHLGEQSWLYAALEVEEAMPLAQDTRLVVTVGGDGTILRAVRLAAPTAIPILGINMGRLGFMTELKAEEALEKVPLFLEGQGWIEERVMLQAELISQQRQDSPAPLHALNDVVVGRGAVARLVRISVAIDGAHLTTYRADAVLVSTATGSTGYNLSSGGPILFPQSTDMVLKPVAPHLGLLSALILSGTSRIELTVEDNGQSMLCVDGHTDLDLVPGDMVRVVQSPLVARFLRLSSPTNYYTTLTQRLGLGSGPDSARALY